MIEEELFYLLALQKVDLIGDINAKKLLYHFGSAKKIFEAKKGQLHSVDGIGSVIAGKFDDKRVFTAAEKELDFIRKNNLAVHIFGEANYPEYLKHCSDGPMMLFSKGDIDFKSKRIISVVGTRRITNYGVDFCQKLISDLAVLDPVIVSGYAYGVDIVAHRAAMDSGLQTIGVLAHGLDIIYPTAHKKYVDKMMERGGFITEFWSGVNPDRENFVKRNRIVAGISEATIVIESADKGGSLITANLASDYNRDVFAVPGRTTDVYSKGCNTLIKTQKAHLLQGAEDVVYILNWEVVPVTKVIQKQLFVSLGEDEQKIYDFLLENGQTLLDLIALNCDLPINKTASLLLSMELKGMIRPIPGKLFEVI